MIYVDILRRGRNDRADRFCLAGRFNGSGGAGGPISKLTVKGHAGYAPKGEDIVCAAASVTAYTAAGALNELCGAPLDCAMEKEGFLEIAVPVFDDADIAYRADIIMETACIGFRQIEASYGGFIKVRERPSKILGEK